MTTNVKAGNSCQFVAEFVDINGNITIPAGATLTLVYPVGLTPTSTSISMSQTNSLFTATWASSVSDLGAVTWNIAGLGSSAIIAGDLRIITP